MRSIGRRPSLRAVGGAPSQELPGAGRGRPRRGARADRHGLRSERGRRGRQAHRVGHRAVHRRQDHDSGRLKDRLKEHGIDLDKWKNGEWKNWDKDKWLREAEDYINPIIEDLWDPDRMRDAEEPEQAGRRAATSPVTRA